MSRIFILPPEISQKIAAGEVIERPFSVVKELVENALDAEASQIKVELVEGGKRCIRVIDDGQGMSRADAEICFERHSTSKITDAADLDGIATLGFRGEALPSISAVSCVVLETADGGGGSGTLIRREADRTLEVREAAFPRGTRVEVNELFFNLPARRKFLKSARAELQLIARYLSHAALAFPGVRFSLHHGNRSVFDYPAVGGLKERLYQVYGKSVLDRLLEVDCAEDGLRIAGFASQPPAGRRDRKQQLFFVNKRLVRDKTLLAALNQAYRDFLEKETHPEAYLFLDVSFQEVDVNVHPAKTEVRFKNTRRIFQFVRICLEQTVLRGMGIKKVYPHPPKERPGTGVQEHPPPLPIRPPSPEPEIPGALFESELRAEEGPVLLGQYQSTYIVAADEDGLLIIDQHNAHERVLYEKYKEIARSREWPRRLSLLPQLVELSASQVLSLEDNRSLLEESGFRVEDMGGRSFAIKEYPDIFRETEAKDILLTLLEEVGGEKVQDKQNRVLATMACRTAVKAGQPLSQEKMRYLLREWRRTTNPSLCPHGRPITIRIPRGDIERGLKRPKN